MQLIKQLSNVISWKFIIILYALLCFWASQFGGYLISLLLWIVDI